MEWTEETEAKAKKLLKKWEDEDPLFKEKQEFGKMLMQHIDSFTLEERKRYEELKLILHKPSK